MALKSTKKQENNQIELFIGIDVHLKTWHVTICSENVMLKSFSQPPEVKSLLKYLRKNYPGCRYNTVYEAGFCGFWIHRKLQQYGVNNIVVNPSDVPITDKEKRQKRDKLDSLKLAKQLRSGALQGIHVPKVEEQEDRNLIRIRKQIVRDVSRYKNRIKSHLYYMGIDIPEKYLRSPGYWSKSFKAWLTEKLLETSAGNLALQQQLETLFKLEEQLKEINRLIRDLAKEERYKEKIELVTSIPGIGIIAAMVILTEVGDINRFSRIDQFNSFAGFIPNVYASGEKEHVGQLTKRGNHHLRNIIIECSWWAIRKDPSLLMAYEKLCKRMKPSKAIIRIARKMLSRLRYVLKNNEPYKLGLA
jgi:transposase